MAKVGLEIGVPANEWVNPIYIYIYGVSYIYIYMYTTQEWKNRTLAGLKI